VGWAALRESVPIGTANKSLGQGSSVRRNLLILAAFLALFVLLFFVFFIFPSLFITRSDIGNTAQRLTMQNDVRTTALQAFGGIVALCAAYVGYMAWKQDGFSSQERRLADLIRELGSDHSEVRLAAVDGLGRLAFESKRHSQIIGKVLAEWIKRTFARGEEIERGDAPELREAIDVLRRLNFFPGAGLRLDFAGADLRGLDLRGADLSGADLSGTILDGVDLVTADLTRANIAQASLRESAMFGAKLYNSDLSRADLEGAGLDNSNLVAARLDDASLANTSLRGATLQDAHLLRASLENARCQMASFRGADCRYARFLGADIRGADFTGALLDDADFTGVLRDASTVLPDGI
jgi:uncharacterized protein YjbI with pentapeptide repeats